MFSFRKSYFRLVGLFDWGYTGTKFILSVSWNRYGFTLAGYRYGKSATDPALLILSFQRFGCFKPLLLLLLFFFFISRRALAREGDYEMMSVCACVRACVCVLVSHADFSKTATDFL